MEKNNRYDTLVEATEKLKERGYTYDFQVKKEGILEVIDSEEKFSPEEVELHEFHRFEGITNPEDMAIIYALETNTGLKGTIVDAYGADGSERVSGFLNNVEQRQHEN